MRSGLLLLICLALGACTDPAPSLRLISTTTTESSGLLRHVLPHFEAETGVRVYVASMGTGQALRTARQGNADLLIVHDEEAERTFIAQGWGTQREALMYNHFLLVGPRSDPAGIAGGQDIAQALQHLARSKQGLFVSRADHSGTHKRERLAWAWAGVDPQALGGYRYREAGAGMGKTLNIAATINAYTLVDQGTWLNFGNRQQLVIIVDGDARLYNPYSVIRLNGVRHPQLKLELADRLADWLLGPAGQRAINDYRIDGQQLFTGIAGDLQQTAAADEALL